MKRLLCSLLEKYIRQILETGLPNGFLLTYAHLGVTFIFFLSSVLFVIYLSSVWEWRAFRLRKKYFINFWLNISTPTPYPKEIMKCEPRLCSKIFIPANETILIVYNNAPNPCIKTYFVILLYFLFRSLLLDFSTLQINTHMYIQGRTERGKK